LKSIAQLKKEIIATGLSLVNKNLVAGTWGNVSSRTACGQLIAITPSGRSYRELQADDIIIVDDHEQIVEGTLKPSSELPLHSAIYQARPDVQAIVHTHSIFASACAVARRAIPPIIEDLVQLAGGEIEVAAYALPGTKELAANAVQALGNKNAVLLANHGVIGCGQSLDEALTACELVEKAAQIYIYANQLGEAVVLSDEDVASMHTFYLEQYRKRQGKV
jgi:L-fuculose-phosphate aldolase